MGSVTELTNPAESHQDNCLNIGLPLSILHIGFQPVPFHAG